MKSTPSTRTSRFALAGAVLSLGATLLAAPTAPAATPPDRQAAERPSTPRLSVVVPAASPRHWDPLTDDKWDFRGPEVILTEPGTAPTGPRRPFEYAVVTKGPEMGSIAIGAQVRIDEAVPVTNRDVIVVWNYQSPTRFYYAHLSTDNTIYPHNGIFVVNDGDRLRLDDQWDPIASRGAPPAITDAEWHDVRVTHDVRTGAIAVYVDRGREPLMTATDTTLTHGRFGFGSFDNFGRARFVRALGAPYHPVSG